MRNTLLKAALVTSIAGGAAFGGSGFALADSGVNWDAVAQCESGGNWGTNTGNGFSGGLQFTPSTWKAYGGTGRAENASREQQISVAERVKAGQGIGAWPVCGQHAGSPAKKASVSKSASKATVEPIAKVAHTTTGKPRHAAPKNRAVVHHNVKKNGSAKHVHHHHKRSGKHCR